MQLFNMGLSKEERVAKAENIESPSLAEEYPYGLRIDLDSNQIKDLGLSTEAEVGKELKICAEGCIVGINSDDGLRMTIQLKDMAIMTEDESKEGADAPKGETNKVKSVLSYYG